MKDAEASRASGATSTFASGLPPSVVGVGGAIDVAFIGETAYVLVALVGDPLFGGTAVDGTYRIDGPSSHTVIADLGARSAAHPPSGFEFFLVNGVQYAIEPFRGGFLVTDGHHNRVLEVSLDGEISEFVTFGNVVPTGLEVHGNTVYVAEAGPTPHLPENGKVIAVSAKSRATVAVGGGAPMLIDVEGGRGRSLYALAQGTWDGVGPVIFSTSEKVRLPVTSSPRGVRSLTVTSFRNCSVAVRGDGPACSTNVILPSGRARTTTVGERAVSS